MQYLPHLPTLAGRAYHCRCGNPIFFRNSACLTCGAALGYDTALAKLIPLTPAEAVDTWVQWPADDAVLSADAAPMPVYARCANLATPAGCNWLIPVIATSQGPTSQWLCPACRLNRTIPDLNNPAQPDNGALWGRVELAKRRVFSSVLALGLPVASLAEDPERGLAFDLIRANGSDSAVMTGHHSGLITLNLAEADDSVREAVRSAMHEPYRTLLGHFRHEIGHYYWDRLVAGTPWMDGFHALFGDETQDYAASLEKNYAEGPPAQWWLSYVSAYASTHPWEDWAECWAHYLHMRDSVDTAVSLGLATDNANLEFTAFTLDALYQPGHPDAQNFLDFLNDWTRLTTVLNEMSRSMGQPDFYPFALPHVVVAKLHFIHLLVTSGGWLAAPDDAPPTGQSQSQSQSQNQSQSQS